MFRRLFSVFERFFDGANPAFALTVRMKQCRRIFRTTALLYIVLVGVILFCSKHVASGNFSDSELFEMAFLSVTCCTLVFLGSDFGAMFIEATFHDELFRLTPLTSLGIVHGGIMSSLFFSFGFWCLSLPFLGIAAAMHYPVARPFAGTIVLFVFGQALDAVLLSCYLKARSWRDIGLGAVVTFLLIVLFAAFCFTTLGKRLFHPSFWTLPMLFLLIVALATFAVAYTLARSHALSPRRTFGRSVAINTFVYVPYLLLVCGAAVVLPAILRWP